jgi:hypothetical protein
MEQPEQAALVTKTHKATKKKIPLWKENRELTTTAYHKILLHIQSYSITMSTASNIILSDDILAPFMGNMCSSFSMSDMNLAQCEAMTVEKVGEELHHHPLFLTLLTHILGWSALASVVLLTLGGLEVKLFSSSEPMMDEDDVNDDDDEKYKKLLTRRK